MVIPPIYCLIPAGSLAQIAFEKTFGGYTFDLDYSVEETQDGGYMIAGYTESFGVSYEDVNLIKTNSLGNSVGGEEENSAFSICFAPEFPQPIPFHHPHPVSNPNDQ